MKTLLDDQTKIDIEKLCTQLWETGIVGDPNLDMGGTYKTAYTLYQLGRYEQAQTLFSRLVMASPYHIPHWQGLGATYHLQKHYTQSLVCWSIYALIDPESPEPHYYAAQCYKALNNTEQMQIALMAAKKWLHKANATLKRQIEVFLQGVSL